MFHRYAPFLLVLALPACGKEEKPDPRADRDSAVAKALDGPLMTDPDLVGPSRVDSALTGGGPASAEIPLDKNTPAEAEAARLAARDLLGGAPIEPAPAAARTLPASRLAKAITLEAGLAALGIAPAQCPAKLAYSFGWAAQLPPALPIYPRGHALVAGGSDDPACKQRAVRYVTPVAAGDVVDFYFAAARRGGLAPEHGREGTDEVVTGKGFAVFAKAGGSGMTEVNLFTVGI